MRGFSPLAAGSVIPVDEAYTLIAGAPFNTDLVVARPITVRTVPAQP